MTNSQLWETNRDCFWTEYIIIVHDPEVVSIILGGGVQIQVNVFEFPIFSPLWYFSNKYFPNQTFFSQVNLALNIYTITNLLLLTTHISINSPWDMDPCAGLHILAHGSIPLPYLPNLCAVLRPAPLASYYFPFLSFPLLSPCIGLSLGHCFGQVQHIGYNLFSS